MTEQSSKFKELKPLENAQAPEEESVTKKLSFWLNSSVVVAIISGILGTTLGAFITGYYTLLLEEKKYEYSLVQKALDTNDQEIAKQKLIFLTSIGIVHNLELQNYLDSKNTKNDNLKTLPLNKYELPDYTVYICNSQLNNSKANQLVREIVNVLSPKQRVGTVKLDVWKDYTKIPLDTLQNKLTIIYDDYEQDEINMIQENLKTIQTKSTINTIPNPYSETKWKLSVIVCPSK